jgi:3-methylfumaryl-CoA hydratase
VSGRDAPVERSEVLAPEPALALAGLLDTAAPDTDALPPLWHCAYLLDRPAQADLGPDGHPRAGLPTPPAAGLRRMFAGGRVSATAPLRIGRPATRASRLLRTVERQGLSARCGWTRRCCSGIPR